MNACFYFICVVIRESFFSTRYIIYWFLCHKDVTRATEEVTGEATAYSAAAIPQKGLKIGVTPTEGITIQNIIGFMQNYLTLRKSWL